MTSPRTEPRHAWAALALSFLSAGIGHVYCGRIVKGLVLFSAWFLLPPLALIAAWLRPTDFVFVGLLVIPTLGVMAVHLYAALDAFLLARRVGPDYSLKDYNRPLVYLLLITLGLVYPIGTTLTVRAFVFEAFYIPTHSMSPSVLQGDRLLVNKLASRWHFPDRGDVVVFRSPRPDGHNYVKRVIALPGDAVEMQAGCLLINGKPLELDPVPDASLTSISTHLDGHVYYETNSGRRYQIMLEDESALDAAQRKQRVFPKTTVPDRSVFVLGDNRDRSYDSRQFGFIHTGDIIGYLQYLYWPAETWDRFGTHGNAAPGR